MPIKSIWVFLTFSILIGCQDLSEPPNQIDIFKFSRSRHIIKALNDTIQAPIDGCGDNASCYGYRLNQLSRFTITSDTNILVATSSNVQIIFNLNDFIKNKVRDFGSILALQYLSADSLVLLASKGFIILKLNENKVVGTPVSLADWCPKNYFFTAPHFRENSVSQVEGSIFLKIGGEWDYPYKRYPSEMRFVFEYDFVDQIGKILPTMNPDFGDHYHVLSQTKLQTVENRLCVNYGSDSILYVFSQSADSLTARSFPSMKSQVNHFETKNLNPVNWPIVYSNFAKYGGENFRFGWVPCHRETSESKTILYSLVIERFDNDISFTDRSISDVTSSEPLHIIFEDSILLGKTPCPERETDHDCFEQLKIHF